MAKRRPARRCVARRSTAPPDAAAEAARCRAYAVRGSTVCRAHGGAAPQVRAAAARRLASDAALREVARLGLPDPTELHPIAHLLGELARARAVADALGALVADLDTLTDAGELHPLYVAWVDARREHARIAEAALRAGVDERRVRIAEADADALTDALDASLVAIGLDHTQRRDARKALAGRLRELNGA